MMCRNKWKWNINSHKNVACKTARGMKERIWYNNSNISASSLFAISCFLSFSLKVEEGAYFYETLRHLNANFILATSVKIKFCEFLMARFNWNHIYKLLNNEIIYFMSDDDRPRRWSWLFHCYNVPRNHGCTRYFLHALVTRFFTFLLYIRPTAM